MKTMIQAVALVGLLLGPAGAAGKPTLIKQSSKDPTGWTRYNSSDERFSIALSPGFKPFRVMLPPTVGGWSDREKDVSLSIGRVKPDAVEEFNGSADPGHVLNQTVTGESHLHSRPLGGCSCKGCIVSPP